MIHFNAMMIKNQSNDSKEEERSNSSNIEFKNAQVNAYLER